jgi:hypothetical protein
MTRKAKYKRGTDICLSALYHPDLLSWKHHTPFHGKASGSDSFDSVYLPDSQTHLERLLRASSDSINTEKWHPKMLVALKWL